MLPGESRQAFLRRQSRQRPVASCRHGCPNLSQLDNLRKYLFDSCVALSEIYVDLVPGEFSGADVASKELDILVDVWSDPKASRTIQKNSYKVLFSMAVEGVHAHGDYYVARQMVRIGCFLREWGKIGKEAFLRELMLARSQAPAASSISNFSMKEYVSTMWKTRTDRGVTLYLAAQTPCACLKAAAEAAAKEAHAGKCALCTVQKPWTELKRCDACNLNQYCSQECQKADWKDHKKVCQGKKPKKTSNKHKIESR